MPHAVQIEFQRVQTYLDAVPRLKDMLGANALLGEAIRIELPRIASETGGLAAQACSPTDDWQPDGDPLDEVAQDRAHHDIPLADRPDEMRKRGILARDGGHFHAIFASDGAAQGFITRAESWLHEHLPGLRYEITKRDLDRLDARDHTEGRFALSQALPDLPAFQVCQETGAGPADGKPYKVKGETRWISRASWARKTKGQEFRKGQTRDLIGLLQQRFPCQDADRERAFDFDDLCGRDYLAVIHADGNGFGQRFKQWLGAYSEPSTPEEYVQRECQGERFFHAMRVWVRRALVEALQQTFGAFAGPYPPYQVLMLGGDDLLLACRAPYALDFLVHYARALQDQAGDGIPSGLEPPTIGAGVAIAAANFPFHQLHATAERLAASAKRLARAYAEQGKQVSVADWTVCTASWTDDPIAARRQEAHLRYPQDGKEIELALSAKPYRILGDNEETGLHSLERLLEAARSLMPGQGGGADAAARSQWRALPAELARGRLWGELHVQEFVRRQTDAVHRQLEEYKLTSPWESAGGSENTFITRLPDLVEVMEIPRLSRAA